MRITAFLVVAACLQASASGHAQGITLFMKNAPLEKVFSEIQRQTGYNFVYSQTLLLNAQPVDLSVSNGSLDEVLSRCFHDQPLIYTIVDKYVVIRQKPAEASEPPLPPGEIHGRITNAQGVPLSGANIIIVRTKRGSQTNAKGEFTLENIYPDDELLISYIGYKTQMVKVGGGKEFPVTMKETTDDLDKVVVQAYGTTTQRLTTGDIATVTAAEIERQPVMNPLQALQGRVPGLIIQQQNGYASAPVQVEIRGRSSINSTFLSEPLYIIDGVPLSTLQLQAPDGSFGNAGDFNQNGFSGPAGGQSPFFSINPGDIESITVLKDADATAIYGSRGANGVIIITSKKGKAGKTKCNINVYEGLQKVTRHYRLLNTQQYLSTRREAYYNDSIAYGVVPDPSSAPDLLLWDSTRNIDWQNFLWGGTGKAFKAQVGLDGGDRQTTFHFGFGYDRVTSILNYSGSEQRASVEFNIQHKSLNQKLNISFTNIYSYSVSDLIDFSGGVTTAPNSPAVFDAKGKLNYRGWDPVSYDFQFANLLQPYSSKTNFLNSSFNIRYEFLKGLSLSTNIGYSFNHVEQTQIWPIISQDPLSNPYGYAEFGNNNRTQSIIEPQLEYGTFVGPGKLEALVGGTIQYTSQNGENISGNGYVNDHLLYSISNAPIKNAEDVTGDYNYAAAFGRLNYNLFNKYIINLSARRDGSSRFGANHQFGNFWSVGTAWIFSDENWFKKHLPFMSLGKIRGSYGITGSDLIGDYQYITRWSARSTFPYQGNIPSYASLQHANPDLQWQANRKLEVALQLSFFKDRANLQVAWYQNRCNNQLIDYSLPFITGFQLVTANSAADVQNRGWEITARYSLIEKKDFQWAANFNIGANVNKLIAFPNLAQSAYAYQYVIGQSLSIRPLLHSTGVDPQTGLYTFLDKNKDGVISITNGPGAAPNDFYYKDLGVKFNGGFGTDLTYREFQLSLFFHFEKKLLPSAIYSYTPPGGMANQSVQVLDHWQKPGDHAKFARYTTQSDITDLDFYNYSDGIYGPGSFIRLQNLSLSYSLPNKLLTKANIKACMIYVRGENLFLITKYNGIDPETPDLGELPISKVLTCGIQFSF